MEAAKCLEENQCNCEFVYDALIRQPSAFWSSAAILVGAVVLYRQARQRNFDLKLWTAILFLLGLSSHFGHGSFTRLGLAMDFGSIIIVISFFAVLNLMKQLRQSYLRIILAFAAFFCGVFFVMYSMEKWTKVGVCLLIFLFALGDLVREMRWSFLRARTLQLSILVLAFSFGLFIMDELKIGCEPKSWFQLHSLWHLGTAVSLYLYGRWRFLERPAAATADCTTGTGA